tara:strand:+ start:847 stop:1119 length:273 start_codon:yes stop_codon:yes gene_type:complete
MDTNELNYYLNTLQKKVQDYFTQNIVLESKIQYQNEIISKQNEQITALSKDNQEYKDQLSRIAPAKPSRKRATKVVEDSTHVEDNDGGTW